MATPIASCPKLALRLPLRIIGVLILVAGFTASWWVWRTQDRDLDLAQEQSTISTAGGSMLPATSSTDQRANARADSTAKEAD